MILQGSLRIEYNNEQYQLMVKTFLRSGAYYFFVSDKGIEKSFLSGKTLELTFKDSFSTDEEEPKDHYQKIPLEKVKAIENMLLENKQLWFY